MIEAIQNVIRSILRFLLRVGKQLSDYASTNPDSSERIISAAPETVLGDISVKDVPPPLAVEVPIILVECTSCGDLSKLTAVCQSCRRPVCTKDFCHRVVYQEDFSISVIQCTNCAVAEPA